jgi:S-adenosylmethionine:tRNA ribosyltransferase-isomerase
VRRQDFSYDLPEELIAQTPLAERSASRLLVLDGATGAISDRTLRDLPSYVGVGDLLVFNDTRVVAARVVGAKPSGGRVEIFLERVSEHERGREPRQALVQLRASKPIRAGLEVATKGGTVRILGREDELWRVELPGNALEFFETWGEVPLPPYIHRFADAADRERYQSIFAREKGAVAAPTASLHFDVPLVAKLEALGVTREFVTLHVGAGTFQPIRTDDLDAHKMHSERASVSTSTWEAIQRTRAAGGRVIAVGTTVVRALESAALQIQSRPAAHSMNPARFAAEAPWANTLRRDSHSIAPGTSAAAPNLHTTAPGKIEAASTPPATHASSATAINPATGGSTIAWSGETRLFIRPGFDFQVVDAMVTNFHLPESTLLMLVSAFAGRENVLAAYAHAVRERYRFFSYGDAMLVTPTGAARPTNLRTGQGAP